MPQHNARAGAIYTINEMAFLNLTTQLHKADERAGEELWSAIGRLVDAVTPYERANFSAGAGYEYG